VASYPGAIKTFTAITTGTKLEQVLFDDAIAEIEAIETELAANVHGSMGSVAERVKLAIDLDGLSPGNVKFLNATDGERKRFRCGVTAFNVDDMTKITGPPAAGHVGTVTFAPALTVACNAFVSIQPSVTDFSLSTIPAICCYVQASGTTTTFQFVVTTRVNSSAAAGSTFLLHWFAIEDTFSSGATGF
jgi:hypothetical protein